MSAIKITKDKFSGASGMYDREDGIASTMRKLAQDLARTRIILFSDLTDSTTGTPDYAAGVKTLKGNSIPAFTEVGTASAPKAGFDTALGKHRNAFAAFVQYLNRINASLGLPLLVDQSAGTVAAAGTIPAQDKALTAVSSNCVERVSALKALQAVKENMATLVAAANRVAVAVGADKIVNNNGKFDGKGIIKAIPTTGTAVTGANGSTLADAEVDAELTKIADNFATIALFMQDITGAQPSDLTGTPGGTGSATALVAQAVPAAASGAATTSSPKAGFDTAIGKIEENLSELATRTNALIRRNGNIAPLVDQTGATVNGALVAQDVALTAVDGSTGTNAVDQATGRDRLTKINNAVSSIAAKVNALAPVYGVQPLTDGVSGVVSNTLADIAATGTGVSGANATLLDTDVDAYLLACASNITSLMNKLNEMTGSDQTTDLPLQVVAFDK